MRHLSLVTVIAFAGLCSNCTSVVEGTPGPTTSRAVQTEKRLPGERVFDADGVEWGVVEILTEMYEIPDVRSAECPENQPVRVGRTFDCAVVIGGERKKVKITPMDEDGEYEIGQPVG